jgi:predicted signal transduction protein with EAL and GGDEF domain
MNSTLKVCIGLGCSFATNLSFAEQSTYVGASHFAFFEVPFLILAVVLSVYCAVTLKNLDISPSPKQLSRAMFAFSSGFLIMAVGHAVMLYRKFNEIDLFIEIFGPTLGGFIWIIALSLTWIFFAIGAYILIRSITRSEIKNETDQLQKLNKELVDKAYNDGLTQLLNRQCFEDNAANYWHDIQNNHAQSQFSVLMIDADYFKTINDKFGHSGGDFVLKTIADNLKRTVRNDDAIFRYGGEEFCALLKKASIQRC